MSSAQVPAENIRKGDALRIDGRKAIVTNILINVEGMSGVLMDIQYVTSKRTREIACANFTAFNRYR